MTLRALSALLIAGATLLSARGAQAQYSFTTIVEDNGGSFSFSGAPASLNDAGQVIFTGAFDGVEGVFVSTGGPVTTIADENGPLSFFGFATITGTGLPSYFANRDAGGSGFFAGANGAITLLDNTPPVQGFGGDTMSSTSGSFITFHAFLQGGGQQIYATDGQVLIPIADNSGFLGSLSVDPRVNAFGQVVFQASLDGGGQGIFLGNGGSLIKVVDTAGNFFLLDESPSINDNGQVIFGAFLDSFASGIFLSGGGQLQTILDSSGPFSFLADSRPIINNRGDIAFLGSLDNGDFGLFKGIDPVNDRVLMVGDAFSGSTVASISAFGNYMNNAGQLVFTVGLEDGRTQVILATAAPETHPLALVLIPGVVVGLVRRRRPGTRPATKGC